MMKEITDQIGNKNSLYTCDYLRDGKKYAVGGVDRHIYVYDS